MNILIASMSSSTKTSSAPILIGDYLIAMANATGSLMTNLKLQKLVFYTQAWHIAVFNEAIFEEDFQAWVHGPVLPVLYDQYKHHQWRPIERTDLNEESMSEIGQVLVPSVKEILADVIEEYFHLDAYALEKSTHREDPWLIARNGLAPDEPSTNIVDKDDLLNYYSRFVKRNG